MNLAILGNVGFLLSGGVCLTSLIVFAAVPNEGEKMHIYAISESITENQAEGFDYDANNFQCKFTEGTSSIQTDTFDCKLYKLLSNDKQKQHYLNWFQKKYLKDYSPKPEDKDKGQGNKKLEYSNQQLEGTKPHKIDLSTAKNMFRVEFSIDHLDKAKDLTRKIEVIPRQQPTENKKYGVLKPLFGKHKDEIIGKTSFYIGQPNFAGPITSSDTCECTSLITKKEKCQIFNFSDQTSGATYSDITFTKQTNALNYVQNTRHYLIHFHENNKHTDIEKFKNSGSGISIHKSSSIIIKFPNIIPVIYEEGYDHLFVFI